MYYRRDIDLDPSSAVGAPDDPVDVWSEFNRIRKHFMALDQNNVRGVRRERIARADDPAHNGISDIRTDDTAKMASLGNFPYIEDPETGVGPEFEFSQDAGTWRKYKDDFYLDLFSRWESTWIVASSAQFEVFGGSDSSRIGIEWGIHSSTAGGSVGSGAGVLGRWTGRHQMLSCITALRVPAGSFRVYPLVRARWMDVERSSPTSFPGTKVPTSSTASSLRVEKANMFAFTMYR